ncbi:class I SAM-dependent DNA methyltransferase [Nonomuraea aurantiaca]|uniref:class I SAM-dependent DNA methyltransferase n=1 Tax=Nonomuraea aurantiaca TaxID=2878562 RepID=UPI001CD9A9C1|nr:class I SAM-dependent methyltransferase [Nonomuraea aurantiaca]MCA2230152.1 class I SAM-dependent methyltransferase [Nonomuraea aurantiaca]
MVREVEFVKKNRKSLKHKFSFAVRNPGKVPRYVRRLVRDAWLKTRHRGDHLAYYQAVMKSDTARNPEAAVGSQTHQRWLALGKMQFDYLKRHGLRPEHKMLEIGCGNLRAGRLLIDYLEPGNYAGIDISPDILKAARNTLAEYDLESKQPLLELVADNKFVLFPDGAFDVVHAHSVYSHCPIEVIEECFVHIGRILKPTGHFDFTFDRTEGEEHHVLHEDFYYRTETLVALAEKHGLTAVFMDDWERLKHHQSKIRITLGGSPTTS